MLANYWKWRLNSANPQARIKAARMLGKTGKSGALRPLVRALGDPDAKTRGAAAEALVGLHRPGVFDAFVAALKEGNAAMRAAACYGLCLMGDVRATSALLKLLQDEEASVRRAAAQSLHGLGWRPGNDRERVLNALARKNEEEVLETGSGGVPALIEALREKDAAIRKLAARSLGALDDARAVKPLVQLTADRDVAAHAVDALSSLLKRRARETSEEALRAAAHVGKVSQVVGVGRQGVRLRGLRRASSPHTRVVDSAEVSRLARAELARRGLAGRGMLGAA